MATSKKQPLPPPPPPLEVTQSMQTLAKTWLNSAATTTTSCSEMLDALLAKLLPYATDTLVIETHEELVMAKRAAATKNTPTIPAQVPAIATVPHAAK